MLLGIHIIISSEATLLFELSVRPSGRLSGTKIGKRDFLGSYKIQEAETSCQRYHQYGARLNRAAFKQLFSHFYFLQQIFSKPTKVTRKKLLTNIPFIMHHN